MYVIRSPRLSSFPHFLIIYRTEKLPSCVVHRALLSPSNATRVFLTDRSRADRAYRRCKSQFERSRGPGMSSKTGITRDESTRCDTEGRFCEIFAKPRGDIDLPLVSWIFVQQKCKCRYCHVLKEKSAIRLGLNEILRKMQYVL